MRPHDFRLSARITAAALFIVVAGAMTWMLAENARLRDSYLVERRADLEQSLHAQATSLSRAVSILREDVLFLSSTPPVSGIWRAALNHGYDARDGDTRARWEGRLQGIFSAFSRAHPDYFHISYIGVDDGGRELVRVDNNKGIVRVMPASGLQARADEAFFKAVLRLREDQVWLSEFTSAQGANHPSAYILRAATPVYAAPGKLFGVVVVNMDVSGLLKSAAEDLPPGVMTSIADMEGNYLLHADSFESGENGFAEDFPALQPMLAAQATGYLPLQNMDTKAGRQYVAAGRIHFDPEHPARFLTLVYSISHAVVVKQVAALPMKQIFVGLFFMLLAGGLVWFVLRRTFAPLAQITAAAEKIISGDHSIRLPQMGGGELGSLSNALNAMLDRLLQREDEFRKELAESLPGIFYMLDTSGRFLMWNRNLEQVLHCSAEEIARSHPLDFFAGEDRIRIEAAIRKVFEAGEVYVDAVLVAKNGAGIPYHFTGRRITRDGVPVLVGLGLDVSEQQQVLHETRALLRRNQALLQNSMEGIHIMDIEGNVIDVNEAFCTMLGYTREEALRLNVADWDVHWSREELLDRLKSLIGCSIQFETEQRRKDGTLLHVEITCCGIELDGQAFVYASSRDITERKRSETVLLRYKSVIETAMDGFWLTDLQGNLLEANEAYAKMTGYSVEELTHMQISQLEANERPEEVQAHIEKLMAQGYDRFETRHRHKDGRVLDIEVSTTLLKESERLFVFSRDITERKQAEDAQRIAAVAFETHDAILITDSKANIIRVNQAFTDITGYSQDEVLGQNPRMMSSGRQDKAFYIEMWQQLLHTGSWAGEILDKRKNGQIYPKWMTITAVRNERQEPTHYVAIFSDITARKQADEEIRNLAFYDALTRLPNRRLFLDRFRAALTISARRHDYGAVMFLDMDRFKTLNDTFGHDYGDLMLIEVASRIKSCVREMDTVARLGGDEFVILVEGVSENQNEASHKIGLVAEKIRESLAAPYQLKGREYHSSPSIGIGLYRGNESPVEEVLRHADMAMYQAKGAGRNTLRFFDPIMQQNVTQRAALEHDLHHAIAGRQLQLHYQIQVDRGHNPLGAEALLRWLHPQRGLVMPGQFIPVAEEGTLILDIGYWVLDQACRQLALWAGDARLRNLTLAVNVSAKQFAQPGFVGQVAELLESHGVVPFRLKLELTESLVLSDLASTISKMHALKNLGIKLAMDDFGTGYSSLSYLRELPLDQIKIDQSFVQGIEQNSNDAQLVRTIIDMAENFRMDVIAEGVETEAQLSFLKQHDCMSYQGFLFSKAVPIEEFEQLLGEMQGDSL